MRNPTAHAALVHNLQSMHFAGDIDPPAEACGWSKNELISFFESGGEELPLRYPDTPSVAVVTMPAGVRARIFLISDMHCDHASNLSWMKQRLPDAKRGCFDVCICSGDVSDNLDILRQVLDLLRGRFDEVLFTPGNHELWASKDPAGKTSLDRLESICALCDEARVRSCPIRVVSPSAGESRLDDVLLVPLHSWYHPSWDCEPDLPDAAITLGPGIRPASVPLLLLYYAQPLRLKLMDT